MTDIPSLTLRSGEKIPAIGLGTWKMSGDTAGIINNAIDIGYRLIDTSGNYGTQKGIGEGLKRSGLSRDEYFITTKIENDEDAYEASRENLEELGIDYADLILVHWPPEDGTAGLALWEGLLKAKKEGMANNIGVSNYSTGKIMELIENSGEVPVVNQIEFTPFGHDQDMLEFCREHGIIIQSYSPLTQGRFLDNEKLKEIADNHGKSSAQIMLRWNIQLGNVPIPKAGNHEHMKENLEIFDFELSEVEMERITQLNKGYATISSKLPYLE